MIVGYNPLKWRPVSLNAGIIRVIFEGKRVKTNLDRSCVMCNPPPLRRPSRSTKPQEGYFPSGAPCMRLPGVFSLGLPATAGYEKPALKKNKNKFYCLKARAGRLFSPAEHPPIGG